MSVFTIPTAVVPDYWTCVEQETPLTYQHRAFVGTLADLAIKYVVTPSSKQSTTLVLDPDCTSNTVMPTEILRQSLKYSSLLSSLAEKHPTDVLVAWEVYSKCLLDPYLAMVSNRRAALKKQMVVKLQLRSFHIGTSAEDLATFDKTLKKIEYTANVRIEWKKIVIDGVSCDDVTKLDLTSATAKIGGVDTAAVAETPAESADGTAEPAKDTPAKPRIVDQVQVACEMTVANVRSWKNRIAISLKALEVYVDMGSEAKYIASSIFLAISSLNIGGISIIAIPKITDTQTVAMICVHTVAFETTKIIHTYTDKTILYGNNFRGVRESVKKSCADMLEREDYGVNIGPDLSECTQTIAEIASAMNAVHVWRYERYERVLAAAKSVADNYSAKAFPNAMNNYLATNFDDLSQRWIESTGAIL